MCKAPYFAVPSGIQLPSRHGVRVACLLYPSTRQDSMWRSRHMSCLSDKAIRGGYWLRIRTNMTNLNVCQQYICICGATVDAKGSIHTSMILCGERLKKFQILASKKTIWLVADNIPVSHIQLPLISASQDLATTHQFVPIALLSRPVVLSAPNMLNSWRSLADESPWTPSLWRQHTWLYSEHFQSPSVMYLLRQFLCFLHTVVYLCQ